MTDQSIRYPNSAGGWLPTLPALLFAALACIILNYSVSVVIVFDPINLLGLTGQIAAFVVAAWFITTGRSSNGRSALRIIGYAASLLAVFGEDAIASLTHWIALPACGVGGSGISGTTAAILARVFQAGAAAALLAAMTRQSTRLNQYRPAGSAPRTWSVFVVAASTWIICKAASAVYITSTDLKEWCPAITSDALPFTQQLPIYLISGFQEELLFAGTALVLLLGQRRMTLVAALAVNIGLRWVLHLYYADHHTAASWLVWAAIWSGAALAAAFWVGGEATSRGTSPARFAWVWSLGAACAHSVANLIGGGVLVVAWALVIVVTFTAAVKPALLAPSFRWALPRQLVKR